MNKAARFQHPKSSAVLKFFAYSGIYTVIYLPLYTLGLGLLNRAGHKSFFAHWADNLPFLAGCVLSYASGDLYFTDTRKKAIQSRIQKTPIISIVTAVLLALILALAISWAKTIR